MVEPIAPRLQTNIMILGTFGFRDSPDAPTNTNNSSCKVCGILLLDFSQNSYVFVSVYKIL